MERKWLALLIASLLLCTGCSRYETPQTRNVVTEIRVVDQSDRTQRHYTDPQKMRQILNGLRQIGQLTTPDTDPEELALDTYQIQLHHSDGTQEFWHTKGDRYIRKGTAPWQQADPDHLSQLTTLLQTLPPDR